MTLATEATDEAEVVAEVAEVEVVVPEETEDGSSQLWPASTMTRCIASHAIYGCP